MGPRALVTVAFVPKAGELLVLMVEASFICGDSAKPPAIIRLGAELAEETGRLLLVKLKLGADLLEEGAGVELAEETGRLLLPSVRPVFELLKEGAGVEIAEETGGLLLPTPNLKVAAGVELAEETGGVLLPNLMGAELLEEGAERDVEDCGVGGGLLGRRVFTGLALDDGRLVAAGVRGVEVRGLELVDLAGVLGVPSLGGRLDDGRLVEAGLRELEAVLSGDTLCRSSL